MSEPIRSMQELVDALRARRDELNISHETIDNIAGLQAGYTSKLLAPKPIKNLGPMSFGSLLGALGLAVVVVPDPDAVEQVEGRWVKRKRPQKLALSTPPSISVSIQAEVPAIMQMTPELQAKIRLSERMRELGKKGGKRRLETLSEQRRNRIAKRAARMRWQRAKLAVEAPC